MLYVCLDMMKPDEVDYSIQTYDTSTFKGIKLTNVLRSLSRTSDSTEVIKDRIECLEKLLCHASQHGLKYCQQIKLDFRLSNEIFQIDYKKIQNENKLDLLKLILYAQNKNKYELAKEFITIYEFNQDELCLFLIDEIIPILRIFVSLKNESNTNNKHFTIFNPSKNEEFSKLVKLFSNSTIFGTKLLEKTKILLVDAKNNEDFMLLTELLIRSHNCFIQSCSMEGISNVLQVCKQIAYKLEKAGEFNIMVHNKNNLNIFMISLKIKL
jgi:hypothetical protein